jgi:beta-lactamase regulating signal transducer with metallopeptidase domain/protocatechuate 3,4-dioxygenase beta subunit
MTWHIESWLWLANAAVGGFLVLGLGCLAARFCRQPVRRLRLLELTLLGCLVVPWLGLASGWPRWSLGVLATPAEEDVESPSAPTEATAVLFEPREQSELREAQEQNVRAPKQANDTPAAPAVQAGMTTEPEPAPPAAPALAASVSWPTTPQLIVSSYATVAGGLVLFWLVGLVKLWRLHRSTVPAPRHAVDHLRQLAGPKGDRVRLLASDQLDVPLTFTWRRPIIVLPGVLCQSEGTAALRYCLAHEWSHVERRDIWTWHLAAIAQFLFFYQPLFWWLRRQLRLCQDYLADARAAEQAAMAEDYADYLVGLARRRLGAPVPLALGIADRRSNLYRRIIMLINNRQPLERRCRWLWTLAVTLGAAVLLGGIATVRLDAGAPADDKKESAQKDTPKVKPKGEPIKYAGKVFDKDTNKGIQGATVTVRRTTYGDPKGEKTLEETKHKTDADGKYSFVIPPEQAAEHYLYIELDVEAPNYAPRSHFGYSFAMIQKNEKLGGRPFFENVDMRPAKEITGLVETPDGNPAAGVKILAYSNTDKKTDGFEYGSFANAKTDAKGRFKIWLITPGPAVFWLLPEKYAPSTHVIKDPEKRGDMGRFTLQPGIVLKGKLLDTKGKPLAGLYVNADLRGGIPDFNLPVANSIRRTATTNDKGEFEMAPLPPGEYEVKADEHSYDPSKDEPRPKKRPLPAVFIGKQVTLKDGQKPEPIEVRAIPHVIIEAQYLDSKGKPTRGHEMFIFGQLDKMHWFGQGKPDADGKIVARVPHGLTNAQLDLMTNEHGVLRHRLKAGGPLNNSRRVDLGTLNDDVKGIQIIRYVAPILVVKVVGKDGKKPAGAAVTAKYPPGKAQYQGRLIIKKGLESDVSFEEQEDGRFRSSQLFPDEEVTVTAQADGYEPRSQKIKLAESDKKDITLELEKKK